MDDVNLIDFDEIALSRGAADDNDDDDSLLIANFNDYDIPHHQSTEAAAAAAAATLTPSPSPDETSSRCSSDSPPPLPFDAVEPDGAASQLPPPPLPPATSILPPRRPPASDLPAPEVSTGDSLGDASTVVHRYNGRASMGLGASQLVVGMSCIALGLAALITRVNYGYVGCGVWGGMMCFVCGMTGILAYRLKTIRRIAVYMGMSVMSSICAIVIFVISTLACADTELITHEPCNRSSYYCSASQITASLVINLMLCVVSMVDLTVCMSSLALALRAFCRPNCCTCDCCHLSSSNTVDTFPWLCMYDTGSRDDAASEFGGSFRLCRQPPPYSPAEAPPPYTAPAPDNRNK